MIILISRTILCLFLNPVLVCLNMSSEKKSGYGISKKTRLRLSKGLAGLLCAGLLLLYSFAAQAFPTNMCAADRFTKNLGCTANDVSVSSISAGATTPPSCVGGQSITLDLNVTVNVGGPARWDVGIFFSNDGKDGKILTASGGAASCSVYTLPFTPLPFANLDGDGCGDIQGPPSSGVLNLTNVTVNCSASGSTSGNLSIPYVVTWDNQASPSGLTCNSNADPVPNTVSKCSSLTGQTIAVTVLPAITKSDGVTIILAGASTTYNVVITNNTGITLTNAVFKDPAVANLTATSVSCNAAGGATCPTLTGISATDIAAMQIAGITIPSFPNGGSVTFAVTGTVSNTATTGTVITNNASVAVNGQSNSASDSDTVQGIPSLTFLKTVSPTSDPYNGTSNPMNIPGAEVLYNLRVTNTGSGSVDSDTLFVTDPIPTNTELYVGDLGAGGSGPIVFVQGSPTSNLTFTYTSLSSATDDVEFSNNGGTTWTYVPTAPYDLNVNRIRLNPKGTMAGSTALNPNPYFELRFRVRIK